MGSWTQALAGNSLRKSFPCQSWLLYCVTSSCDIMLMVTTITTLLHTDNMYLQWTVLHCVIHFLFIHFILHTAGASQWSACLSIVMSFISLELNPSCITPTMWSVEITTFRQFHSVHWQYNSYCGVMCCQSVTVASRSSWIECPGLSEMIHNAIGYDARKQDTLLSVSQYHSLIQNIIVFSLFRPPL